MPLFYALLYPQLGFNQLLWTSAWTEKGDGYIRYGLSIVNFHQNWTVSCVIVTKRQYRYTYSTWIGYTVCIPELSAKSEKLTHSITAPRVLSFGHWSNGNREGGTELFLWLLLNIWVKVVGIYCIGRPKYVLTCTLEEINVWFLEGTKTEYVYRVSIKIHYFYLELCVREIKNISVLISQYLRTSYIILWIVECR